MPEKQSNESKRRDNDGLHKRRGIWSYSLVINGERRFFSTGTRVYKDARNIRADAVKLQRENKLPTDAAKQRFELLLAKVLGDRKPPFVAENTQRLERERSVPLLKHFSGRRMCEIDADAIRAYQIARSKVVSTRTVNLECKLLRQALKAAKLWGILADDFKSLKEDRRGPGRALEDHQEKLLLDTARSRPTWDAAFYGALAAANTTARGHELKNLRIRNVNLIGREVVIPKSKTEGGEGRRIPFNDAAMWAFARLLERAAALGAIEPDHYLFPAFLYRKTKAADRGTGYDPTRHQKTWRSAWRSLVRETMRRAGEGIENETERKRAMAPFVGLRFHDLRHGAITKLAESEASDQTIMAIAGHLDRAMLEHYSHIRAAAKRKAVDSMRGYIPGDDDSKTAISERVQ